MPVRYSISAEACAAPRIRRRDDEPQVQPVLALVVVVDLREGADEAATASMRSSGTAMAASVLAPAVSGGTMPPTRLTTPSSMSRASRAIEPRPR